MRFWRLKDGTEVDFIWIKNQKPYPIEVKGSLKNAEVPSGIRSFLNRYPDTKLAFVLNQEYEGESRFKDTKIVFEKHEKAETIPERIK